MVSTRKQASVYVTFLKGEKEALMQCKDPGFRSPSPTQPPAGDVMLTASLPSKL